MREIKFRAWNKTVNKFTYFGKKEPIITSAEVPNGKSVGMFLKAEKQIYLTPYEDPQQFICLKDKNEKEIYEGDILCVSGYSYEEPEDDWTGEVVMGPLGYGICGINSCGDNNFYYLNEIGGSYITTYEVLGNIYENPELLEGLYE